NFDTLDGDKDKDGYKGTAPVKSFEKFSSPFGIVNMVGNVWEWTKEKILKGGGYLSLEDDLEVKSSRKGESYDKEGFRCIKVEK
ncbi:MAG: SUMF1/EgtB/PvdO family nonheme iron enzyme, partial [Candidatus Aminicenantes bacterium]|nr:SUMF1/EgtB/PvdO family nonheme iron enzyme [Candidatus Aminicenantes bacterium]NIM81556.1 SUMF1/EgtB/PvdO family nonheme iron enzyme [Candidatus Aminicenantes bacterium]NIN20927.1 SUMF1/EgtB/PvdO family nonheme iron enzyme [Candidatus Aminicenantes bacterium]NIN44748.1 SUMF1/EgtB/PvdO family nonheme iron enzyme [Candidatus Aminicenantes bacterium]NIN87556.1 SUMF1/EgtB/PvdO family nonheme iron enzyme [Candidatus Aminicenantes bacterium]